MSSLRVRLPLLFLAGILLALLAITVGVPVLHPEPEAVDAVALVTKAIEAAGLLTAWSLVPRPPRSPAEPSPKGT